MLLSNIKIWSTLEVLLIRNGKQIIAKCKLAKQEQDGIIITMPSIEYEQFKIEKNESIRIRYCANSYLLEWICKCTEEKEASNVILYKLFCDEQGKSINRRNCLRITILEEIDFSVNRSKTLIHGELIDISYEGIGFTSTKKLELDDVILFTLDKYDCSMSIQAKILREINVTDETKYNYGAIIINTDRTIFAKLMNILQLKMKPQKM